MSILLLGNLDPKTTDEEIGAFLVKYGLPEYNGIEHMEGDGPTIFLHACKLGFEGIVSKRASSRYQSGRTPHWLKFKNPNAPAVKREAEEDWGK